MKVIILAGGLGTRLSEETVVKPKPLVEIGGHPILWHIMNLYSVQGFNDFVVALGYKGEMIKDYFMNYQARNCDLFVDLSSGRYEVSGRCQTDWKVALLDTGIKTQTGGRIGRVKAIVGQETFMATYGDGLADIDLNALLAFHRAHGKLATVTAVHPPSRFGALSIADGKVLNFAEKPQAGEGWINGGFFVLEPEVFNYISGDESALERDPMKKLSSEGQLMAYYHHGFFQPMDTLREKQILEDLWQTGNAPWKKWASE